MTDISRQPQLSVIVLRLFDDLIRRGMLLVVIFAVAAGWRAYGRTPIAEPFAPVAQASDSPLPSFEVVSIKPNRSANGMFSMGTQPGKFIAIGATLRMIIEFAYNIRSDDQLSGGPSWVDSDHYDIDAKEEDSVAEELRKLPDDQSTDQVRLMVQAMLADRFQLKIGRETKELAHYALVVAKNGPKLTPAAPSPDAREFIGFGGRGKLTGSSTAISVLADVLSRQPDLSGRTVVDETGLTGKYDFTLQWTPDSAVPSDNPGTATASRPDSSGASLFSALQEQLGLKLELRKGPVKSFIIQNIQKPSGN